MAPPRPGVPWRAIVLGAVLLPPFTYFGMVAYIIVQTATWMGDTLLRGPLFLLCLLTLASLLLRRLGSRLALSQHELLVLFAMVSLGTALCGTTWAMFAVPSLAGAPVYYAEAQTAWQSWIDLIPRWFMVQDRAIIDQLHEGHATLYSLRALRALAPPVLTWSAFMLLLVTALGALASLVARPWIERERLTFPLTILPLEMTRPDAGAFWRNRSVWAGIALAAWIECHNSIAYLYPSIPTLPVKVHEWPAPATRPWSGLGSLWTSFYPFQVGLGFLLPLDVSFSIPFFFFLGRLQDVLATALGFRSGGGYSLHLPPYHQAQNTGAVLVLAAVLAWRIRGDLVGGWRDGRHRRATVTIAACLAGLIWLTANAGIPTPIVVAWFALYLAVALVMGRLVAESGIPSAMAPLPPQEILYSWFGSTVLNRRQLVAFGWLRNLDERFFDTPLMHQLGGVRLQHELSEDWRPMRLALSVAAVIGVTGGMWALLHLYFQHGLATAAVRPWPTRTVGQQPFVFLQGLLDAPREPGGKWLLPQAAGALAMAALLACRARYAGFPLHPLGYAVSGNWALMEQWCPFVVAYLLKAVVLRLGGVRLYRRWVPFFLGLILADLVVPVLWAIAGVASGRQMYLAFPH